MAKKKHTDEFSVKNSMIFERSDRKKADEDGAAPKKPKNRKRLAMGIVATILIVFIGIPWLIVNIAKSNSDSYINDGQPKKSYSELLSDVEATEKSTELHSLKNPDLKDQAAVERLIAFLQLENELGSYTVEVQNEAKPYTLTLKFKLSHDVPAEGQPDKWEQTVIQYSTAILSLINNIAEVRWEFPVGNGTGGSYFTRADAEKLYNLGVTAVTFAKTPESVQLMLNQLGIDLY
jgi:hypothetical protein